MPSEEHYNDTESHYFLLFLVAVILFPYTYWFIKRKVLGYTGAVESIGCRCSLCKSDKKQLPKSQGGITIGTILHFLLLAGLWAIFAYIVLNMGTSSNTEGKEVFDPYQILGIEYGASTEEIKKAYRAMSLKYHPDKADNPNDPEVQARYINIVKANQALTDEVARANWEKYGNPDGPQAMSIGIALPSWLVKKDNSAVVLGVYLSLLIVGLPAVVCCWWRSWKKYDSTKVMNETMAIYYHKVDPSCRSKAVLELISVSVENKKIPLRVTDEQNLAKATKNLSEARSPKKKSKYNFTVPYGVKAHMLYYAHLGRVHKSLSPALAEDLNTLLVQTRNLVAGFITICTAKGLFVPLVETIYLLQMITQGCWKGEELMQLPHMTFDMMDYFASKKRNCGSLPQLIALGAEKRATYLKEEKLDDAQIADIETVLDYLPLNLNVSVDLRVEGEDSDKIVARSVVTCFYTVTRGKDEDEADIEEDDGGWFSDSGSEDEDDEAKQKKKERREKRKIRQQKKKQQAKEDEVKRHVHAPYFPEKREESWWIVIGDSVTQQLVAVTKVGNFGKKSQGKMKFLAPEKPGTYVFNVHLLCDGYLGCDRMRSTKIVVISDEIAKKQQAQQQHLQIQKAKIEEIKEESDDDSDLSDDDSATGSESD